MEADKKVRFGMTLNDDIKKDLVDQLKNRITTFAWNLEEVNRPSHNHAHAEFDSSVKSVQQKKRKFASKRQQIIKEEINKLLNIGLIKEVQYLM